jgi:DNA-binding CsgD family transcriptional regulator
VQKPSSSSSGNDASESSRELRESTSVAEQPSADSVSQRTFDYDYRVRALTSGELEIEALSVIGEQRTDVQGICYEVLHGRSSPCEDCPLRGTRDTATTIRPHRSHQSGSGQYELRSATRTGTDTTSVSVRHLSVATFAAMLQVRLDEVAARARLSDRERTVLKYLMQGAPLDEIAAALDIGTRTVKFHQANLLSKLGADSRTDLLRVLF